MTLRGCCHQLSRDFPSDFVTLLSERVTYHIDRRIYFNLSKSTQIAAELKALKLAANGRYLMCKALPYY